MKYTEPLQLVRPDKKLWIYFPCAGTLQAYLDFVRAEGDPGNRHFIPILENDGVIPVGDPDFDALLVRMGIVASTIFNTLRAHFLVSFCQQTGGLEMQSRLNLDWVEKLEGDVRKCLILNLRVRAARNQFRPTNKNRLARDVCVPIVEAIDQGKGVTHAGIELVEMAERRGFSKREIVQVIVDTYQFMCRSMSTREAAKYTGYSPRKLRHVANKLQVTITGIVKDDKGRWQIPVTVIDSLLEKDGLLAA